MAVSITLITPAMEVHRTGCSDIDRIVAQRYSRATKTMGEMDTTTFTGETLADAADALNRDFAAAFCVPYAPGTDEYERAGCWTFDTCHVAPCVRGAAKPAPAPKPLAPGRCAGSGQLPASKVDPRYAYPTGKCPVCGEFFGAKTGRIAHHNAPKPVVAKPKCGHCGETTLHRSGFCSTCRAMAAWGAPGYEDVRA